MGRVIGTVATSSGSEAAVEATAYTEPTSGAQRALKSASANDTAAGTGAQKVKITYYTLAADGTIAGPFVETVTLNGVTAVATVATNIALIEKMEIVQAGSGGVAAGIITLTVDAAGAGAAIGTIAAGARATAWAHHYVPSKTRCRLTDVEFFGGDAAAASFSLRSIGYAAASPGVEGEMTGPLLANNAATPPGGQANWPTPASAPAVLGPARIRAYVTPANVNAQTSRCSFGFVDERTVLT